MKLNISKVQICIFVALVSVNVTNSFPLYGPNNGDGSLRPESGNEIAPIECCPSVTETVQNVGGKNRHGLYVELYRDENNTQTLYEYTCKSRVIDEACRNIKPGIADQTRCIQKYAFTLALVKDIRSSEPVNEQKSKLNNITVNNDSSSDKWYLDYIESRSGCAFQYLKNTSDDQKKIDEKHPDTAMKENVETRIDESGEVVVMEVIGLSPTGAGS